MKNILLIVGHPDEASYNFALADAYQKGAQSGAAAGAIRRLNIRDLDFDPNLRFGYRKRMELEPDLLAAWEDIQWADHLVWVYPVWWGSLPAIMKGFIDRLFLPGFVFRKHDGSLTRWDKLLSGKTARIIQTLDQPGWYYRLVYSRPTYHAMKQLTMGFTGVRKVKTKTIGPLRLSTPAWREKQLTRVKMIGAKDSW